MKIHRKNSSYRSLRLLRIPGAGEFSVDRASGDLLLAAQNDVDAAQAVGLTVKSGTRPSESTAESLYKTGNLFRITHVQTSDDGSLVCAEVVERVKVVSLSEKDGHFSASCEPGPDLMDLNRTCRPGSSLT